MNNDSQLDSLVKQMAANHRPELPSPGLIWWRSQILEKHRQQARIERPMQIMRMVAAVVGLGVLLALVTATRDLWKGEAWWLPLGAVVLITLVSASLLRSSARGR